jgi:hypothetical protein
LQAIRQSLQLGGLAAAASPWWSSAPAKGDEHRAVTAGALSLKLRNLVEGITGQKME